MHCVVATYVLRMQCLLMLRTKFPAHFLGADFRDAPKYVHVYFNVCINDKLRVEVYGLMSFMP